LILTILTITITEEIKPTQNIQQPVNRKTRNSQVYYNGHYNSRAHAHIVHPHSHIHGHVHPHDIHGHLVHPHPHLHSHIIHPHAHLAQNVNHLFHSFARNYINIARLAYCPKKLILAKTCKACPSVLNTYKSYFIHSINLKKKRLFQFVILYSDAKKEVLVTFSGPKTTTQTKFFNKVYKKGFKTISALGNIKIEKFYWEIYSKYIRKVLFKKMKKVNKSKRSGYKFVLVGHSFGGSIATLAAYDLVRSKIIKSNKKLNSPIVYTYGLMRIGDSNFVKKVNALVKVVRIVRSDDFVTRVPSCVYDASSRLFRCYRRVAKVIRHYPAFRRYFLVYRRGLTSYRRSIVRRVSSTHHHHHVAKVRAHRHVGRTRSHYHAYYSQPLGTILYYTGSNFSTYNVCKYVAGIPVCEKKVKLPSTFSPTVHSQYYGINVELC
jgi:hypothetical protein